MSSNTKKDKSRPKNVQKVTSSPPQSIETITDQWNHCFEINPDDHLVLWNLLSSQSLGFERRAKHIMIQSQPYCPPIFSNTSHQSELCATASLDSLQGKEKFMIYNSNYQRSPNKFEARRVPPPPKYAITSAFNDNVLLNCAVQGGMDEYTIQESKKLTDKHAGIEDVLRFAENIVNTARIACPLFGEIGSPLNETETQLEKSRQLIGGNADTKNSELLLQMVLMNLEDIMSTFVTLKSGERLTTIEDKTMFSTFSAALNSEPDEGMCDQLGNIRSLDTFLVSQQINKASDSGIATLFAESDFCNKKSEPTELILPSPGRHYLEVWSEEDFLTNYIGVLPRIANELQVIRDWKLCFNDYSEEHDGPYREQLTTLLHSKPRYGNPTSPIIDSSGNIVKKRGRIADLTGSYVAPLVPVSTQHPASWGVGARVSDLQVANDVCKSTTLTAINMFTCIHPASYSTTSVLPAASMPALNGQMESRSVSVNQLDFEIAELQESLELLEAVNFSKLCQLQATSGMSLSVNKLERTVHKYQDFLVEHFKEHNGFNNKRRVVHQEDFTRSGGSNRYQTRCSGVVRSTTQQQDMLALLSKRIKVGQSLEIRTINSKTGAAENVSSTVIGLKRDSQGLIRYVKVKKDSLQEIEDFGAKFQWVAIDSGQIAGLLSPKDMQSVIISDPLLVETALNGKERTNVDAQTPTALSRPLVMDGSFCEHQATPANNKRYLENPHPQHVKKVKAEKIDKHNALAKPKTNRKPRRLPLPTSILPLSNATPAQQPSIPLVSKDYSPSASVDQIFYGMATRFPLSDGRMYSSFHCSSYAQPLSSVAAASDSSSQVQFPVKGSSDQAPSMPGYHNLFPPQPAQMPNNGYGRYVQFPLTHFPVNWRYPYGAPQFSSFHASVVGLPPYQQAEGGYGTTAFQPTEPTAYMATAFQQPESAYPTVAYHPSEPTYISAAYKQVQVEPAYPATVFQQPGAYKQEPAYPATVFQQPPAYPGAVFQQPEPTYVAAYQQEPAYPAMVFQQPEPTYVATAYKQEPPYPAMVFQQPGAYQQEPAYPAMVFQQPEPTYVATAYKQEPAYPAAAFQQPEPTYIATAYKQESAYPAAVFQQPSAYKQELAYPAAVFQQPEPTYIAAAYKQEPAYPAAAFPQSEPTYVATAYREEPAYPAAVFQQPSASSAVVQQPEPTYEANAYQQEPEKDLKT